MERFRWSTASAWNAPRSAEYCSSASFAKRSRTCWRASALLRKASFSRQVALAADKLAPASLSCSIVEIGDLNLYDEDAEAETPPEA